MKSRIVSGGAIVRQALLLPIMLLIALSGQNSRAEDSITDRLYELIGLSQRSLGEILSNDQNRGAQPSTTAQARLATKVAEYRSQAEQGSPTAQFIYGYCHFQGFTNKLGIIDESNVVEKNKNHAEGFKWTRKAAEQGLSDAQIALANCYREGRGTQKDAVTACMWFNIGSASNPEQSGFMRTEFEQGMTPEQIAEAKRMSVEWKPRPAGGDSIASKIQPKTSENPESKEITYENLLDFKNVTVLKIEPDGLRIRHTDGVTKVKYELLPEDIRKQFGMSDLEARNHRIQEQERAKKQAIANAAAKELKDQKLVVSGAIFQISRGQGILLKDGSARTSKKVEDKIPYEVVVDGPTGLYPKKSTKTATYYRSEWKAEVIPLDDLVFIECDTNNLIDGTIYRGEVYPCGTYSYETVLHAEKTVAKYTTNPMKALMGPEE